MKIKLCLVFVLFLIPFAYSDWKYNPFTDELDYYLPVNTSLYINESYINDTFIPYTGATSNVDLGLFNITMSSLTCEGYSYYEGNLIPLTTLTHNIGSGANRWRYGYFQNISSDYIINAYDIESTGNITGDYFIGSGVYITDLNISGDLTGYMLNVSFLAGHGGVGAMDMRGDPWYLSGTDLELAGDITASNFIGDGSQLTNVPSYNESYEWFLNSTIFQVYNATYESFSSHAHNQDLNTTDNVEFNIVNTTQIITNTSSYIYFTTNGDMVVHLE